MAATAGIPMFAQDIFAFGATLYHLLTNTPPPDSRERFLHPESMVLPRQVNAGISPRTERAILWAMSLHPSERPPTVEAFRQALLGDWNPPTRPLPAAPRAQISAVLRSTPERILLYIAGGLVIISLAVSLAK